MTNTKVIKGKTSQPSLCFYNALTKSIQRDIWSELENGLWEQYSIDNRLHNNKLGEMRFEEWKPIFPNIFPIYPGCCWDMEQCRLKEINYKPHFVNDVNWHSFINVVENYFAQFAGKKIGVHLSGGLDSGIIMCLMNYLHIPYTAIGLYSKRYEFRTEYKIQQILAEQCSESYLLDFDEYPFYSNLSSTPKHQIPDASIKMNDADKALALAFAERGVEVVLTGQGGDSLFVDAHQENISFNIANTFTFPWEQDLLYSPLGIKLTSFYADTQIIDYINSLRIGQKEDPLKLWARNFFRDILPKELSEYCYCADFFGLSMSGLESAKKEIVTLFEEANERLPHPIFAKEGICAFLSSDILSFKYDDYQHLCAKISIAVWLHALFREL